MWDPLYSRHFWRGALKCPAYGRVLISGLRRERRKSSEFIRDNGGVKGRVQGSLGSMGVLVSEGRAQSSLGTMGMSCFRFRCV